MRLYKNGDRCPCCGQRIEGKSDDWLELFSRTVDMLRLPPWEAQALSDLEIKTAVRHMLNPDAQMLNPDAKRKRGRPVKQLDPDLLEECLLLFQARKITGEEAAYTLGIGRSTFFLKLKQLARAVEGVGTNEEDSHVDP